MFSGFILCSCIQILKYTNLRFANFMNREISNVSYFTVYIIQILLWKLHVQAYNSSFGKQRENTTSEKK